MKRNMYNRTWSQLKKQKVSRLHENIVMFYMSAAFALIGFVALWINV